MSISNEELIAGFDDEEVYEEVAEKEYEEDDDVEEGMVDGEDLERDQEDEDDRDNEDQEEVDEASEDMFAIKVNGEEMEVSESELIKGYSTNKASQAKFAEASTMRKEAETLLTMLRDDPTVVLERLGFDVSALAQDYLGQKLELDNMSEEQRELYDTKRKLAGIETQNKQRYEKELEEQTETARVDYLARIESALTVNELPTNDFTTKRMAYYLKEVLTSDDKSVRALSDADIVELVEEDYIAELKTFNPDKIEAMLGKDVANKIRKNDIKKVRSARIKRRPANTAPVAKKKAAPMSWDEYQSYLDNIK